MDFMRYEEQLIPISQSHDFECLLDETDSFVLQLMEESKNISFSAGGNVHLYLCSHISLKIMIRDYQHGEQRLKLMDALALLTSLPTTLIILPVYKTRRSILSFLIFA